MTSWRRAVAKACLCCALAFALCALVRAQVASAVVTVDHGPNAPQQQSKPYVILVSLDGFRYDYARRYGAKNLGAVAAAGASAPEGMIPAFPSVTFPNHYTIVTGLYPEHHGIVAMAFYDPARNERFAYNDLKTSNDGSWYGGVPLWALAEKQGMRSACFFWPGSEAEIAGTRPSYYVRYDDKFPDGQRIDQVIDWLRLPPDQRPHLITLYYSNVDHAGHEFGPDAPETAEAVRHVDDLVGQLMTQLKPLHLPVDVFVVSDHGMENLQGDWIDLDKFADLSEFTTVGQLLYPQNQAAAAKAYEQLHRASDRFLVYRRDQVPAHLHYSGNPRIGDPVIVATGPYSIRGHGNPSEIRPMIKGMHGYDATQMKSMRAIFFAAGPDIRANTVVAPFENVSIYPLIAHVLGLRIGQIDGRLSVLQGILEKSAPRPTRVPATAASSH